MGSGGVIVPPATYFEKIQAVLRRHDVLFLADEVICGFGRLGDMFGCQTFDIAARHDHRRQGAVLRLPADLGADGLRADLAGLPARRATRSACSATASPIRAIRSAPPSRCETLKIYEEMDIVGRVRAVAPRCRTGCARYAEHPLVGEVRGIGLVAGLELVRDKATREPFAPEHNIGLFIERRCQEHGVILRALGDTLTVAPPLIAERDTIDEMVRVVGRRA